MAKGRTMITVAWALQRADHGEQPCWMAVVLAAMLGTIGLPGVVQLSTGVWYDPDDPGNPMALCKHGNPNVLTRDIGTSVLDQRPIAHSTLVEVVRFEGPLPEITVFDPPEIIPLTQHKSSAKKSL